jgi:uncharacterized GH25 family protein
MTRLQCSILLVCLLTLCAVAEQNSRKQKATLNFTVVKEENGKPVKNAEVILHPVGKDGKQKDEGLELKTHDDGKTGIAGIPYGKLRIQVIAKGYRTYGQDVVVGEPTLEITIKLQEPKEQFSIYK